MIYEGEGSASNTTNNRMELMAAIKALRRLRLKPSVYATVYTDSQYVCYGITKYINNWVLSRTINGDLWSDLQVLNRQSNVHWVWIKAHGHCHWNNYVDLIARHSSLQLLTTSKQ